MWIVMMTLVSSVDCILAGMSYAGRGIRIPFFSKLLLFLTALIVGCIAQAASVALANLIPDSISGILGQLVLLMLALFMLAATFFEKKPKAASFQAKESGVKEPKTLFKLVLKSAGITIQILKNPEDADINQSGRIDPAESVLLSVALTLDSVGLILCGALINQGTILLPIALSVGQLLGLVSGEHFGKMFLEKLNHKLVKYLPAFLLMIIAGIGLIG